MNIINTITNAIHWLLDGMSIDVVKGIICLVDYVLIPLWSTPCEAVFRFFVTIIQIYMNFEEIYEAFSLYFNGDFVDVWQNKCLQKGVILFTAIIFFCFLMHRIYYKRIPWWFVVGYDEDDPGPEDGGPDDEHNDDEINRDVEIKAEANYRVSYSKRDFLRVVLLDMHQTQVDLKKAKIKKKRVDAFNEKWKESILKEEEYRLILQEEKQEKRLLLPPWKLFFINHLEKLKKNIREFFEKRRAKEVAKKAAHLTWARAKLKAKIRATTADRPRRLREARAKKRAAARRQAARDRAFLKKYRKDMREFRKILAIEKLKNEQAFKQQQEWNRRFRNGD